jgi:hypothetical protein
VGVIVSSIFRNSYDYLDRYVDQVVDLENVLGETVKLIVAEGDSTDETPATLDYLLDGSFIDAEILTVNHGGPEFTSVNDPVRWAQIALVCNAVLRRVQEEIQPGDTWLYVESDLVWTGDTLAQLVGDCVAEGCNAVAPLSLDGASDRFYDIWGYTKDGQRFDRHPPYHPGLTGQGLIEIDTAGSCFAMRGHWTHQVAFSETDCIRGIGHSLAAAGGQLWLDQDCEVMHP